MPRKKADTDKFTENNLDIDINDIDSLMTFFVPKKFIKTLGIDLSIGKVKLCLLTYEKDSKSLGGGWSSLPVE